MEAYIYSELGIAHLPDILAGVTADHATCCRVRMQTIADPMDVSSMSTALQILKFPSPSYYHVYTSSMLIGLVVSSLTSPPRGLLSERSTQ